MFRVKSKRELLFFILLAVTITTAKDDSSEITEPRKVFQPFEFSFDTQNKIRERFEVTCEEDKDAKLYDNLEQPVILKFAAPSKSDFPTCFKLSKQILMKNSGLLKELLEDEEESTFNDTLKIPIDIPDRLPSSTDYLSCYDLLDGLVHFFLLSDTQKKDEETIEKFQRYYFSFDHFKERKMLFYQLLHFFQSPSLYYPSIVSLFQKIDNFEQLLCQMYGDCKDHFVNQLIQWTLFINKQNKKTYRGIPLLNSDMYTLFAAREFENSYLQVLESTIRLNENFFDSYQVLNTNISSRILQYMLNAACKYAHFPVVKFVLKKVSMKKFDFYLPLKRAIGSGDAEIVDMLIKSGANATKNYDEDIIQAINHNFSKIVDIMFKNGADITSVIRFSLSKNENVKLIEFLAKKSAELDTHIDFDSLIEVPIRSQNFPAVEFLLNKGADINKAFITAIRVGKKQMLQFLAEQGANVAANNNEAIRVACDEPTFDIVKFLVKEGADVTANNNEAIKEVSFWGDLDVMEYLVSQGADITVNNNEPLQIASKRGNLDIVEFLVNKDANVTANNNLALRWASKNGHLKIVKLLVEHGADATARNNSAVKNANKFGHQDVVEFLLQYNATLN